MTLTSTTRQPTVVREPEPVTVLPCCSDDEYARRIAKSEEVRDYIVPGYLAA